MRIIWKRWWVIALVGLIAAVAAYFFSESQQTYYTVRSEYSVSVNRLDSGAVLIGPGPILNDYRNQIYNPDQLQGIAQQLGLDHTGSDMMEFVRVQPQPGESKMVIEVEYPGLTDQQGIGMAREIALAVGERLNAIVVEKNRNLQGQDRLTLTRTRPPQFVGYSPNTRINVLAGGLLGGVLGLLLAFVLFYLDDTLKTAADVERYTELVTIGAIPSGAAQGGRVRRWQPRAVASGLVASATQRSEKQ